MWHCVVGHVLYSISEGCSALVFRVIQFKQTAWPWRWRHCDPLKLWELYIWHNVHIPEELSLLQHCCENLNCCMIPDHISFIMSWDSYDEYMSTLERYCFSSVRSLYLFETKIHNLIFCFSNKNFVIGKHNSQSKTAFLKWISQNL